MTGLLWTAVVVGVPLWAVVLTAIWARTAERRADARRVLLIAIMRPEAERAAPSAEPELRPSSRSWISVVACLLLAGLVVLLWRGDLDRNDKIASVVSVFLGAAGLVVAVKAHRR